MTMSRQILGRAESVDALRKLLLEAAAAGERELWCSDPDFADWPLNEPALLQALAQWALPHRRLHLLAQHYDEMPRRHPRFVHWRRDFGHVVDAWCAEHLEAGLHPRLLVAGARSLEVLDPVHWRSVESQERSRALLLLQRFDAIAQRSAPGFAASTLGL